jgi:3-hydroxyisobutyrate dehydrogenase-like beta-hydroxyacid dehydrogenase
MLTSTLFNCPIYVNYGKGIINSEFEKPAFAVPLILKDMLLVQQTAAASRSPMPIVNLLCDRYLSLIAKGKETWDSTALALGAAEDAGLKW